MRIGTCGHAACPHMHLHTRHASGHTAAASCMQGSLQPVGQPPACRAALANRAASSKPGTPGSLRETGLTGQPPARMTASNKQGGLQSAGSLRHTQYTGQSRQTGLTGQPPARRTASSIQGGPLSAGQFPAHRVHRAAFTTEGSLQHRGQPPARRAASSMQGNLQHAGQPPAHSVHRAASSCTLLCESKARPEEQRLGHPYQSMLLNPTAQPGDRASCGAHKKQSPSLSRPCSGA